MEDDGSTEKQRLQPFEAEVAGDPSYGAAPGSWPLTRVGDAAHSREEEHVKGGDACGRRGPRGSRKGPGQQLDPSVGEVGPPCVSCPPIVVVTVGAAHVAHAHRSPASRRPSSRSSASGRARRGRRPAAGPQTSRASRTSGALKAARTALPPNLVCTAALQRCAQAACGGDAAPRSVCP
jgi:hypothetical protein